MKKFLLPLIKFANVHWTLFAFLTLPLIFSACSQIKFSSSDEVDINKGKEIVKVNNTSIRQGYLDFLGRVNPRAQAQLDNPHARKQLIENLVDQELLFDESLKRGINKKKDIIEKLSLYKKIIIAQSLLEEELDKQSREYYEAKKNEEFTKVNVSQIQINFKNEEAVDNKNKDQNKKNEPATEAEKKKALEKANNIRARLLKGEDFAALANEFSDDKLSKRKGGDMGAISRDDKRLQRRNLGKLGEVAFTLKKDEISEPIELEKAYFIIKVTSDVANTPFEEAQKIIQFQIQNDIKNNLIADLRKNAKIVYAEEPKAETQPISIPQEDPGLPDEGTPPKSEDAKVDQAPVNTKPPAPQK